MNSVSADQLQKMRNENEDFLLINTLDEEHFAKTQIPGSINIPQSKNDFVEQVEETADSKDQTVVLYCASEQCDSSTKAAKKLEQAGFSNVCDFEAGAEGWKQSGEKLVTV